MKKRLTDSISAGVLINILSIVLLKSISIIIAPIMTRIMATDDYGIYSIYNTWAEIIGIVAGLGIAGSLTNFRVKSSKEEYYKYCWNSLLIGIIGHLVCFFFVWGFKDFVAYVLKLPEDLVLVLIISSMASFCVSFLSNFFIIDNQALYNAGMTLFSVAGSFGISIFIVYFFNVTTALYLPFIEGNLFVNLMISIVCVIFFGIKGRSKIRLDYVKYGLRIGAPLIFHSLAMSILGSSDRIMLQHMDSLSSAGVYAFSYSFAGILLSIWYAINSIFTPFYFKYLKNDNKSLFEKKRNFDFLFTTLSMGFVLVYPEVFKILADEKYWGQMKIIPIIVIAFYFNHMYSFPANYETYREKTNYVAIGTIGAAIINIIFNIILIPLLHETGAAIATAISYFALFVFHIIICKLVFPCEYPFRKTISPKFIVPFIASIISTYCLYDLWLIRWGGAIVIGVILFRDMLKRKSIL